MSGLRDTATLFLYDPIPSPGWESPDTPGRFTTLLTASEIATGKVVDAGEPPYRSPTSWLGRHLDVTPW
jgi:hypothetical protein